MTAPRHPDARGYEVEDTPRSTERTYLPYLDVTRILAVLAVVGIHVVGGGVSSGEVGVAVVALDMALFAAVPVFFMMAGALALDPRAHRGGPAEFLRRRAMRIVPAMVVWSAFYIVVIRGLVSGLEVSTDIVLAMVVTGQTYTHLYFLFAIAGLYLLTPLIHPFLAQAEGRRAWTLGFVASAWTLLVMGIGQAAKAGTGPQIPLQLGTFTFFLAYLGYFVLGRAMLVRPVPRTVAVVALLAVPGLIALTTWLYVVSAADAVDGEPSAWSAVLAPSYVSPTVMVYSIVLMSAVSSLFRSCRVPEGTAAVLRTLGNATFGVFLVHFAVLVVLRAAVPALDTYQTLPMLITWTVTVLVSGAVALLGHRVPGLRLIL